MSLGETNSRTVPWSLKVAPNAVTAVWALSRSSRRTRVMGWPGATSQMYVVFVTCSRQELRMPHGLAPLFSGAHLDSYGFLSFDIDMNVPGLVTRLEDATRVIIRGTKRGAFVV